MLPQGLDSAEHGHAVEIGQAHVQKHGIDVLWAFADGQTRSRVLGLQNALAGVFQDGADHQAVARFVIDDQDGWPCLTCTVGLALNHGQEHLVRSCPA